jgi:folate-binding Fe-S cluster repair protein YgfZ
MLGWRDLYGVSFTKGCYIGQELTSRMKHRATSRKRILTATAEVRSRGRQGGPRAARRSANLISSHGQPLLR